MADPVSLAAAAAGFIGLAGQLAQGVVKLNEIRTTMNDAPRDLANLCSSMDLLRNLLDDLGAQIQTSTHATIETRTLRGVVSRCEESRYRLEAHVNNIARKTRTAAMKYLFKKSAIQEMLSDVEQCKTSLIIAQQTIDSAMSSFRHEALLRKHTGLSSDNHRILQQTSRVETIVEAVSTQQRLDLDMISRQVAHASERSTRGYQSLRDAHNDSSSRISEALCDLKNQLHSQNAANRSEVMLVKIEDIQRNIHASNRHLEELVSRRSDQSHLTSAVRTNRVKVGFQSILFSFSIEVSSEQNDQQTKGNSIARAIKKSVCTMRLPKWFVQDQYNLAIARSKNGWLFHPSVYRVVDLHSPFFEACERGDIQSMKMLLDTKQAHLGDRGRVAWPSAPETYSALSRAVEYGRLEACQFLVKAGILSFVQSCDYTTVLVDLATDLSKVRVHGREILRLIEIEQDSDLDWLRDLKVGSGRRKILRDVHNNAENVGGTDLDRFEAQIFYQSFQSPRPNIIRALSKFLRNPDHVRDIQAKSSCSAWMLFLLAANMPRLHFGCHHDYHGLEHALSLVISALTTMCDAGLDIHAYWADLTEEWQDAWSSGTKFMNPDMPHVTPFAMILFKMLSVSPMISRKYLELQASIEAWVTALHGVGVDLAAYATQEAWIVDRVLMRANVEWNLAYRMSYGPEPADWKIERGPPGEAYPTYFWRAIEATPIVEDLAVKVLDLMRRVEHPITVHHDVPGSWQTHSSEVEQPTWNVKGWLAYLEDGELAVLEADVERLDAEGLYDSWDLSSMTTEWPHIEKYWHICDDEYLRCDDYYDWSSDASLLTTNECRRCGLPPTTKY